LLKYKKIIQIIKNNLTKINDRSPIIFDAIQIFDINGIKLTNAYTLDSCVTLGEISECIQSSECTTSELLVDDKIIKIKIKENDMIIPLTDVIIITDTLADLISKNGAVAPFNDDIGKKTDLGIKKEAIIQLVNTLKNSIISKQSRKTIDDIITKTINTTILDNYVTNFLDSPNTSNKKKLDGYKKNIEDSERQNTISSGIEGDQKTYRTNLKNIIEETLKYYTMLGIK